MNIRATTNVIKNNGGNNAEISMLTCRGVMGNKKNGKKKPRVVCKSNKFKVQRVQKIKMG